MRIIAGRWRGRKLTPLGKGDMANRLRPTPDRVRESLFSMLTARDLIEDARVLDLFAGTGALGFEALSRGAAHTTFVEKGRVGQNLIRANVALLDAEDDAVLLGADATRLPAAATPCDLVFLDPPYGKGLGAQALASAASQGWLASGAHVLWEESAPQDAPDGFAMVDQRTYGDTSVTLLRWDMA